MKKLLTLVAVALALAFSPMRANAQTGDPWAECLTQVTTNSHGMVILITCVTQSCPQCVQFAVIPPPYTEAYSTCGCSGSGGEQCCDLLITNSGKVLNRTIGSCAACNEPGTCHIVTFHNEDGTYTKLPSCGGIGV